MTHIPHFHYRREDDPCPPPPETIQPVTAEQLGYFTEQTDRAVRKALRIFSRRAVLGFIILFIASIGNAWYTNYESGKTADEGRHAVVRSGTIVAVDSCNRAFRDRVAVRGVLTASKDFTLQAVHRGTLGAAEAQERIAFYEQRLRELPLPDCRAVEGIITDDPLKTLSRPTPLYPNKDGTGPAGPGGG